MREEEAGEQPGGCCGKDVVDTDGYDPYPSIRVDAAGVAFEVFVTEILSRDPEIELVSASLRGGGARETAAYGTSFVAVRRGRTLLIEARAVTPQTSRRLEEQSRHLQDAARGRPAEPGDMGRAAPERQGRAAGYLCPARYRAWRRASVKAGHLVAPGGLLRSGFP